MKYNFIVFFILLISCKKYNNISNKKDNDNPDYEKAWNNLTAEKNDSAFYYFNEAKINYLQSNNELGSAKCMMNMAIIQSKSGDVIGSQENAVSALKIFRKINDTSYIGTTFNILGTNEISLGNTNQSIKYLNKAIFFSNNKKEKDVYLNNKAMAFSDVKNSDSCFIILKKLISSNKSNEVLYSDNFEYLSWQRNKNYKAEPQFLKNLDLRIKSKNLWGQNASYAHLANYFEEKNPKKSLFHAHKMYEIAKKLKSPDDELSALQKLVNLENPVNSKKYFKIFQKLNDSLVTSRTKAKNQFALIRYETEKNRADFLDEKAKNTEINYQLLIRNIALGLSFLLIVLSIFWYKKRKKRLKKEKELEVKKTELKYSKKIHDVLSNGVYQVMSEIENSPEINKPGLLNKLELLYEKSRDISYENFKVNTDSAYKLEISSLVNSFSSEVIKPVIIGNEDQIWNRISPQVKSEFLLVLRELLVNMKKHSEARKLKIEFEIIENQLFITYTDDGIGLGEEVQKNNGLQNTEIRIFSCGGTLNFDQTIEKGTKIKMSFPLK